MSVQDRMEVAIHEAQEHWDRMRHEPGHCRVTGHECGTDTRAKGSMCDCDHCVTWAYFRLPAAHAPRQEGEATVLHSTPGHCVMGAPRCDCGGGMRTLSLLYCDGCGRNRCLECRRDVDADGYCDVCATEACASPAPPPPQEPAGPSRESCQALAAAICEEPRDPERVKAAIKAYGAEVAKLQGAPQEPVRRIGDKTRAEWESWAYLSHRHDIFAVHALLKLFAAAFSADAQELERLKVELEETKLREEALDCRRAEVRCAAENKAPCAMCAAARLLAGAAIFQRERDDARLRLDLARDALLRDGYFKPHEIGPDIAPRIMERLAVWQAWAGRLWARAVKVHDESHTLTSDSFYGAVMDLQSLALSPPGADKEQGE